MTLNQRQQVVYLQVVVAAAALLGLLLVDRFSPETFFFVTFVGFLVVVEATAPTGVRPRWRRRLRRVLLAATALFGAVVAYELGAMFGVLPQLPL